MIPSPYLKHGRELPYRPPPLLGVLMWVILVTRDRGSQLVPPESGPRPDKLGCDGNRNSDCKTSGLSGRKASDFGKGIRV